MINRYFICPPGPTTNSGRENQVILVVTRIVLHVDLTLNNLLRPEWLSAQRVSPSLFPLQINTLSFLVYSLLVIDVLQINDGFLWSWYHCRTALMWSHYLIVSVFLCSLSCCEINGFGNLGLFRGLINIRKVYGEVIHDIFTLNGYKRGLKVNNYGIIHNTLDTQQLIFTSVHFLVACVQHNSLIMLSAVQVCAC